MFGGLGALIGAAAGHFLVDRKGELPKKQRERVLALTAGSLVQLMRANNRYSPTEERTIHLILEQANMALGNTMSRYDLPCLISQSMRIPDCLGKLAQTLRPHPELRHIATTWCWRVAACETTPAPAALNLIDRFTRTAGLEPQQAMQAALLYYRGAAAAIQDNNGREKACTTLSVAYDASNDQIKQAFRKQSLKYHPDKHANLDPDIQQLTAEKFAQIKDAYEVLQGTTARVGDWYAHSRNAPRVVEASPDIPILCFICHQPQRLPAEAREISSAHCPLCQALLTFDRHLAEHLIAQETARI